MERTAVLVSCGAAKRDNRSVAWKLYESTLFEKSMGAAMMMGEPYIMSAKHGLLNVDERIEPYNETLRNYSSDEKLSWARSLEIPEHYDKLVLLGGKDYVEPICEVYGDEYEITLPYDDCSGNGQQMAVASEIMSERFQQ